MNCESLEGMAVIDILKYLITRHLVIFVVNLFFSLDISQCSGKYLDVLVRQA